MLLKPCYVGKRDNHSCLCAYTHRHTYTHILGWQTKHSHKDSFHHLLSKMLLGKRSANVFMIPSKPINTQDDFNVKSVFFRAASS